MSNELLFITCPARQVEELVEQLGQQLHLINHVIALHGITEKARDGFVIVLSEPGFPQPFLESLKAESLVNDFVRCHADEESQDE